MSVFRWLEEKVFLGEVLKDYGTIDDERVGVARLRTSILLCRRSDRLRLIFRQVGTAVLGASVRYIKVDVTPESLRTLEEILLDARKHSDDAPVT